jgi:ABC-type glycerol-3-phosphate transport system permease component
MLTRPEDKTLSVLLGYARDEYSVNYGMMSASIVFAIAPMIAIYILIKNQLIRGMAAGAVKG